MLLVDIANKFAYLVDVLPIFWQVGPARYEEREEANTFQEFRVSRKQKIVGPETAQDILAWLSSIDADDGELTGLFAEGIRVSSHWSRAGQSKKRSNVH